MPTCQVTSTDATNSAAFPPTVMAGFTAVATGVAGVTPVGTTTLRVRGPMAGRRRAVAASGPVSFERTPRFHQPIAVRIFDPLGRVPTLPEPRRFQLLVFLAPLVMGCTMAYLFHSPRYLLFAVLSPVIGIGNYIDSRRSGRKDHKRRSAQLRKPSSASCTPRAPAKKSHGNGASSQTWRMKASHCTLKPLS